MKSEVVRKMDELGRIVIPIEMRNALGWDDETKISISRQGERLVLQTYQGSCFVCGSEENLKQIHGKYICRECVDELNR
ncbi:MAG: AbrB/MazE/SpoVT family DNA-binding domain-containing protein [Clostridiales bacterium]|jgi:transcriptional pleiotropic regulator of transition state genes|nr:AbrB/MazE/SpoVT family DNA-binding domain-containing protein [Clostridiales bacterium]